MINESICVLLVPPEYVKNLLENRKIMKGGIEAEFSPVKGRRIKRRLKCKIDSVSWIWNPNSVLTNYHSMVVFLSCAEENRVKTRNSGLISSEFKELFSFPFLHSSSCNIQRLRLCPIMWCKCGPTCPHVRTSQPPDLRIYIHNFF